MNESEPDETIRTAILQNIAIDHRINRLDLHVGVLHCIVHLSGRVDTIAIRRRLETMAKQVPGVRGVVNRIDAPGSPRPDRKINLNLKT